MADLRTRARAAAIDAASVGLLACVALPTAALCLGAGAVALAAYQCAAAAGVRAEDMRTGYTPGRIVWRGGRR